MLDEKRRHRLVDAFTTSHGEEVAMALAESLFSTEFATKADIKALQTRIDACATKADLEILGARLDTMEDRFRLIDNRFDTMESHFRTMDFRFDAVHSRFDTMDFRFGAVDSRFDACATKADIEAMFSRQLKWLVGTMLAFVSLFVAFGGAVTVAMFRALEVVGS